MNLQIGERIPFPRYRRGKTPPAWGGIYGLSNAQGWIYIHATENIQEFFLANLRELNPAPEFRAATGFTFELCGPKERAERCKRLSQELHSVANEGAYLRSGKRSNLK